MSESITPAPQDPSSQHPNGHVPTGQDPAHSDTPASGPSGAPQTPPQAPPYQQPAYPGQPPQYQRPPYQQPQAPRQGFAFDMPHDAPKSFQDAMPAGGLSGMFNVAALPMELKVSYWIWLVGGALGVVFGLFGLLAGFAAVAMFGGVGALVLVLVLVAVVLAAAQVILAMKMKEGKQWARLALTILAALNILLSIGVSSGNGAGSNWFGTVIAVVAAVLMWLPNSQAWFQRHAASA